MGKVIGLHYFKQSQANAEWWWKSYIKSSENKQLSDVYTKWSEAKENAFTRCCRIMHDVGGEDLRIISHSVQFFAVAFVTKDKQNGNIIRLFRITAANQFYCDM